ncbi:MAG: hypothetical protein ACHP8B_11965 [Terriglobales bacterium]
MKKLGLLTICLLLINSMAFAQARPAKQGKAGIKPLNYTGCDPTAPLVNIIGAGFEDFMPVFGDNYVQVNLKAGHSYSAEVWDPRGQYASGGLFLFLVTAGCAGLDNFTDVAAMDPDLTNGFSDRISWIQASDSLEFIHISSFDTVASHNYNMRVVDTTLNNARWSTVVGFSTHYGFLNTTEFDIGGTLTLTESGGTQHVVTFTIPAGGEVFEVVAGDGSGSPGLNLPPNLAGSASFVFVGAAGAIKADGYFQAVQNGVFVIVPTAWAPKNNQ